MKRRGILGAVGAAFLAALFCKAFLFDFMLVEGISMEAALFPGDVVFVNRVAYGLRLPFPKETGRYIVLWKKPAENDIVVFWTPQGGLAVKRIAALIEIAGEERFIAHGDNSRASFDSRSYGPVPLGNIVGKVVSNK